MAVIDIGDGATDRATEGSGGYTYIVLGNPANASGKITSVELWFHSNATGVKAGTLYGSGTDYTSRDYETIGNVTSGSKQTFTSLDCDVVAGDYIGVYAATGEIEIDSSGYIGVYFKSGDQFGAGQQTYTSAAGWSSSVYGEGETAVEGLSIPIAMHHYKMMAGVM